MFREMSLFLLHGVLPEGDGIDGVQQFRGKEHIHVLGDIAPAQIVQIVDIRLEYEIVNVGGKLLKLPGLHQTEGRRLHRTQQLPVLRGEGGPAAPTSGKL